MSVLGYQFPGQQGFDVAVLTINAWSLKLVRRQPAVVSGGGLILLANLLLQIRSRKAIPPVVEVRTTPGRNSKTKFLTVLARRNELIRCALLDWR